MELVPALATVGGSYACYLLVWRRVRAAIGRRRGPDLPALSAYDHLALERELEALAHDATAPESGESLAVRFVAMSEARHADSLPPGPTRHAAAAAALASLRRLGDAPMRTPAWSGLEAHLETLRISLWSLEMGEVVVRRLLRRALGRHPEAPCLHLVRAHLAATLGDPSGAADHLARALYYAGSDPFYAKPIVASPYLARVRPALDAQARALLAKPESGALADPTSN
ncbi:hypothetical protein [Vulgatibacter incomptus]|uniref:Uncharacterized protein n=1 Tax=Vulgatibacter incomptus TaxID=1391653 RepID=A0A0K1PDD4_9BACT|nr:hypothetical protein [Vulgatibacter incomptus]AKU91553.1 hypothetical protein AKJ08_1940 [Vulgatibacter incomptus]